MYTYIYNTPKLTNLHCTSLSWVAGRLAVVVGSGLKISQPLPATDSFPSVPRKLSMSLDDMLHQMNKVQEEKSCLSLYLLKSAGACVHIHCESVYISVHVR